MNASDLAILITEIENGGPSPFYADQAEPMPVIFANEMEMTAGKAVTSVFGEEALATIIVTSFRRILYLQRRGEKDQCRSYWHKNRLRRLALGGTRWLCDCRGGDHLPAIFRTNR